MKTEFDDKAASWDEDPARIRRAEVIGDIIKQRIDLAGINRALEYGSGTGLLSFAMQDGLKQVVLMDESAEMTRMAREKCQDQNVHHFEPRQYDLMQQELPGERFDLIYIMLTLHHVSDYQGLLKKFAQLLTPGGKLAIIDLEKEDGSFHDGEFHGHHGFSRSELDEALGAAGLAARSYEVCYELEKTNDDGTISSYPLFLLIAGRS